MRILTNLCGFTHKNLMQTAKSIMAAALIIVLSNCGEEVVRTESEYMDRAKTAHNAGNSKIALFELGSALSHYPENIDLYLLRGQIFLDLTDGSSAEISFNKAVKLGYNPAFVKKEIGEAWLQQGQAVKVINFFEKEISQNSKNHAAHELVGRAYLAVRFISSGENIIKNLTSAREHIDKAYELSPNTLRNILSKAKIHAAFGEYKKSLEWLAKADGILKDQRITLEIRGEVHTRLEQLDAALATYQLLTEKYPQFIIYKLGLGNSYLLKGDYGKARKIISVIYSQYPNNLFAASLLSRVELQDKKYAVSKQLSDKILAKSPNDLQAIMVNGASSYFMKDYENANRKLGYIYNRTRSDASLKLLAATKLKLGEYEEVGRLLQKFPNKKAIEKDMDFLQLVAVASARIGNIDQALENYKTLVKQNPDNIKFLENVALIEIAKGNFDDGFTKLEKAYETQKADVKFPQLISQARQQKQTGRALAYIDKYKEAAPESPNPWLMSAVARTANNDLTGAREHFEKALSIAPDNLAIINRYAIFEKIQGNNTKSLELARQALDINPSNFPSAKLIISDLTEDKEFQKITDIVDKALTFEGISPESKLLFADYYTNLGRPEDTLSIIEDLPATLKKHPTSQWIAGKAYLRMGQFAQAISALEIFIKAAPTNIQARKQLAKAYLLTDNIVQYQQALEDINKISSKDTENQIALAEFYISTNRYNKARAILGAISDTSPSTQIQRNILEAGLAINEKQPDIAVEILKKTHKESPPNGTITTLYVRALTDAGKTDEAIKVANGWIKTHPTNYAARENLANLYLDNGDYAKANVEYEKIPVDKGNLPTNMVIRVHNNMAIASIKGGDNTTALKHAQKALDLARGNPLITDTYAQVLLSQGNSQEALTKFDEALSLLRTDDTENWADINLHKAQALKASGKIDDARKLLKEILDKGGDFAARKEAEKLLSDL